METLLILLLVGGSFGGGYYVGDNVATAQARQGIHALQTAIKKTNEQVLALEREKTLQMGNGIIHVTKQKQVIAKDLRTALTEIERLREINDNEDWADTTVPDDYLKWLH